MDSTNTSSWRSVSSQKLSSLKRIKEKGEEALVTTSTRELVEFYWTNRKRFSGGYVSFPSNTNINLT